MIWILCVLTALFSGCEQRSQERHYTEVILQTPDFTSEQSTNVSTASLIPATSDAMVSWRLPDGWKEGASDPMRLASFYQANDPTTIDCSIVALPGSAGGIGSNLTRWIRQLGLQSSKENLDRLIKSALNVKTTQGITAVVYDFSVLRAKANASDKSMVAAMIPMNDIVIFVKMTGSVGSIKHNKDNFLILLGSIARK